LRSVAADAHPAHGLGERAAAARTKTFIVKWCRARSRTSMIRTGYQARPRAGDAGAAYVFLRTGTTWAQQAYLKASNTGATDQFGVSVAIAGDTIVVGANLESSNGTG